MDVNVGIDVAEDGSGTVTVAVGVDDDLLSRVPGAADRVHLDDLKAAGWRSPVPRRKPTATPGCTSRIPSPTPPR